MSHAKETFSRNAADSAVHSLIEEVELTPKPGLLIGSITAHTKICLSNSCENPHDH
jgi:triphosphoribosyl-dephospho-CoA synthetase